MRYSINTMAYEIQKLDTLNTGIETFWCFKFDYSGPPIFRVLIRNLSCI